MAALRAVGPDAPTLAGRWSAATVASHVAAQDRFRGIPARLARTLAVVSGWRLSAFYLDRPRLSRLVNGPATPWSRSLDKLEKPPPSAVLVARIAPITLWEHFVHHEDVRRPNGLVRASRPDLEPVLDWILRYNRRRFDYRVHIDTGDAVRTVGGAGRRLTVRGAVDDVVMWLSGRDVPGVEYDSPSDAAALRGRLAV